MRKRMKKNSRLHILIETSLLNKLKKEAEERKMSLGQYCRTRLRKQDQLNRIEGKIDRVLRFQNIKK